MEDQEQMFALGGILFEWNVNKTASNLRKHRISFAEGATLFIDESGFLLVGASRVRGYW